MKEFLGEDIVQGKGLNCSFIISSKPLDKPINERAIPISIFYSEEHIKQKFLKKWLKEPGLDDFNIRNMLDWNYYIDRLSKTI